MSFYLIRKLIKTSSLIRNKAGMIWSFKSNLGLSDLSPMGSL